MYVEIGNGHAIEAHKRPDGTTYYTPLPGEHTTTVLVPEGTGIEESLSLVLYAMEHHMDAEGVPAWVDSDSEGLKKLVEEHYGLAPTKRPRRWGSANGR